MNRLAGKVAIITGGASGMGLAAGRIFVVEGASVVIADVSEDAGRAAVESIGEAASFRWHDVSSWDSWEHLVAFTLDRHGKIDVLVNNAGISYVENLAQTTPEMSQKQFEVNQLGVVLGMKAVVPSMVEQKSGSIINTSSMAGIQASSALMYGGTKWAVRGMTKTVALEVARAGVRVNSVHPGVINTPMMMGNLSDDVRTTLEGRIPMGRLGEPEDVANMMLFLASDESRYCTGSEFVVDGGVTSRSITSM